MKYKKEPGKTTADIFFINNYRKAERECEAYVNPDNTLDGVMLDGSYRKANELKNFNVSAVDFKMPMTLYL